MSKRSHIRAIDGEEPTVEQVESVAEETETTLELEDEIDEEWLVDEEPQRSFAWVVPAAAVLAIAALTIFFGWVHSAEMFGGNTTAQQWTGFITAWAIPVLLVVSLWLLAMRSSTREAERFGNVAHLLSAESAHLEERLVTVNRELSLAREFLGTQTRELDFLGRTATERLSEHADRLQALVHDNGEQVESIATVSTKALENMDRLRDNLPVIANSARDVSNQIGGAGRTAQNQLGELIAGFERLNEFGAASERQVGSLRKRVDEALDAFAAQAGELGTLAAERFAALRSSSEEFRNELDSREVAALAAIRARSEALHAELASAHALATEEEETTLKRVQERMVALRDEATAIAAQVRDGEEIAADAWQGQIDAMQLRLRAAIDEVKEIDAKALDAANRKLAALREEAEAVDAKLAERNALFEAEVARRREEIGEAEEQATHLMSERLAALDEAIAARREAQLAQMTSLAEQGEDLGERIGQLGTQIGMVAGQGREAQGAISHGIEALNSKLVETREALDGTDMAVSALTDASVRLLELIQASAKQSSADLPEAMRDAENRLIEIERRAEELKALLDEAKARGDGLTETMDAAENRTQSAMDGIEGFQSRFGETAAAQVDSIERLRAGVSALSDESNGISQRVQGELRDAIGQLEESARTALASIETDQAERIERIAAKVGERSASAIDRAVEEHSAEVIAKLDEATSRSSEASRETIVQLRDQLARVNELTSNLESRIARARERAEENVDNDFTRRVALLTESLNSNAIDIGKVLSTEVTDTAWAAYLRGDRGIFTRRAVRLLENNEAREVADLYDADPEFRENVSRYIHDFEAMLRTMLSTRDGNAVSVTLLSSDMGKLYVALAQAIERLRN